MNRFQCYLSPKSFMVVSGGYFVVIIESFPRFRPVMLLRDIVSWTLTIGWKNEKRTSSPTKLDLEAGYLLMNRFQCYLSPKNFMVAGGG